MKAKLKRIFLGLGITLLVLILGYLVIRPALLRWGASAEEVSRSMPGDMNGMRWTRAITIAATPEQIWPWLVQWGQGRGGWYSYDWLENVFGFDIHTANQILPEFQNPAVGDPICMAPGFCPNVSVVEPYQWFGWLASDPQGKPMYSFIFGIFPVDGAHSRLVVRESFSLAGMPPAAVTAIEIPDVVMEQKSLDTVKRRVEGLPQSVFTTPYEIVVWIAALVIGVMAAVQFVTRKAWKKPLAVGLASVVVLLVLTFLFPPLWLRGVLDLGLLAGLVWHNRQ
jgi:hypothetical protein